MFHLRTLLAFILLFTAIGFSAEFSATPYLYSTEKSATLDTISFQTQANGSAKLVKINGEEALLVVDNKLMGDKAAISSVIEGYYRANFYPSADDFAALKGYADAFKKSRNVVLPGYVGEAWGIENYCKQALGMTVKPCNDYSSCIQTASIVCSNYGAGSGCDPSLLAPLMVDYIRSTKKFDDAYAKFTNALNSFGPNTVTSSLTFMDEAFDLMKTGADEVAVNKLGTSAAGQRLIG